MRGDGTWGPFGPGRVARPRRIDAGSRRWPPGPTHAELSTLQLASSRSRRDRVVAVADRYRDTADSAIAGELDGAERGLLTARRAVDRALRNLAQLD